MNSNYSNQMSRGEGGGGGGRFRGRRGRGGRGRGRGGGGRRRNHHHHNHNNYNPSRRGEEMLDVRHDVMLLEQEEIVMGKSSSLSSDDDNDGRMVRVAVQGCCHGELDRMYATFQGLTTKNNKKKVELLLCCGDFQSLRNIADYSTLAVPPKYKQLGDFYQYYSGQKKAPILTIFIGGNHEASGYLQELYYGGWVAPNIYYLGAAGVVTYKGLRIGGISGIYKDYDYMLGRYEYPPYDHQSLRTVYHVRNVDVTRLKCLSNNSSSRNNHHHRRHLDIMLSHDWPRGIEQHGDTKSLLRKKKFFAQEIKDNTLGSPANEDLLKILQPKHWFAAHLHVKFQATYHHHPSSSKPPPPPPPNQVTNTQNKNDDTHESFEVTNNENEKKKKNEDDTSNNSTTAFMGMESSSCMMTNHDLTEQMTQFLSLDKCLPRRPYMQLINIPITGDSSSSSDKLQYDLEWLAILQKTHSWSDNSKRRLCPPSRIEISQDELHSLKEQIQSLDIPENFQITVPPHGQPHSNQPCNHGKLVGNPQTDQLLHILGLNHILTVPYIGHDKLHPQSLQPHNNINTHISTATTTIETQPQHTVPTDGTTDENEISLDDDDDDDNIIEESANTIAPTNENPIEVKFIHEEDEDENEIDLDDDDDDDDDDIEEEDDNMNLAKKIRIEN